MEYLFEVLRMVDMEATDSERAKVLPKSLKKRIRKDELSRLRRNIKK